MKKIFIITAVSVLLAAACNKQAVVQQSAQNQQDMQQQVELVNIYDLQQYSNSKFGFQLTFTDAWKGYKVKEDNYGSAIGNKTDIAFQLVTKDPKFSTVATPLTITIYPVLIWNDLNQDIKDGLHFLGKNQTYIFNYQVWETVPSDFKNVDLNIQKVLASFQGTSAEIGLQQQSSGIVGKLTVDGKAVAGMDVKIQKVSDGSVSVFKTDNNGNFKIVLDPGKYLIKKSVQAQGNDETPVSVTAGNFTQLNLNYSN